ncbi:MAG: primosomal protein N' [Bacilli bacterium]|nr:primosomal protein N' [Bacilli bacterium]
MFAEVLVEYTNKAVDKTFTYIIPNSLINILQVGMKVKVPFANKLINGIVLKINKTYNEEYELKEIKEIVNPDFVLNKELLSLGKYLSDKTLCSKIVSYQTMLPSALKVKNQIHNYNKYDIYVSLNKNIDEVKEYINNNLRNKAQIEILNRLMSGKVLKKELSPSACKKLLELNIIKEEYVQKYRINYDKETKEKNIKLNSDQINAINRVKLNENKTYLIHGVTGSGKTQVYMNLIEKVLKDNKTAIMLLPEISLTTQMINMFYQRFNDSVAIFHSGLSDGEKYDEYLKIIRKEVSIVVGTRSAIFTPLENLGIVIIDEEHSETYHQDVNPRYSAIDMAKFRCAYNKCPLVLGSATPTLETFVRAKKEVYELITMPRRVNNQILPNITIVDMESEVKKGRMVISELLENKIRDRLSKNEQIILLLNRRGYSTVVTCKCCGYTYKCPHCDITLTYHKNNQTLRCHYCGYTKILDKLCPECHEDSLSYLGLGTEKLEKQLQDMFDAKIIRMDVDTTTKKGSHENIIESFKNHEYDILLGTQMISKGLDFPLVTLVGVINADSSLNIPDFRSGEKTFELLSQVSGRAGRDKVAGEVIIESFNPDNYYLQCVKNNSYEDFYNFEMNERKKLKYPPYYYLINIRISGKTLDTVFKEATNCYNYLRKNLAKETIIYNPTPASIFKVNNIFRYQILIKYRYDGYLINTLKKIDEMYATNNSIDFSCDFNPSRF